MTETLLDLLLEAGPVLLFVATALSCLAVPIPTSLMMLSAGAFAASEDLSLVSVALAAFAGAVIGDQVGFALGRAGGAQVMALADRSDSSRRLAGDARAFLHRWGGSGIFLSRWLFSPLGPYVNFVAAGLGMRWLRFTTWGALGEAMWVMLYVGLGYAFSAQLAVLAEALSNISGVLAAGAFTAIFGYVLLRSAGEDEEAP